MFNEPLSNLDAALRVQTRLEIAKLHHDMTDVTMVYVTHDQVEAMTLADRICVLRDENVEHVRTPAELYENLNSIFVALHLCGILGDMISMRALANYAHRFDDDGALHQYNQKCFGQKECWM